MFPYHPPPLKTPFSLCRNLDFARIVWKVQYHVLLIVQRNLLRWWNSLDKERNVLAIDAKDLFLSCAPEKRRVRFPSGEEKLRCSVPDNREDREGMSITPGRRQPYQNYVRRVRCRRIFLLRTRSGRSSRFKEMNSETKYYFENKG